MEEPIDIAPLAGPHAAVPHERVLTAGFIQLPAHATRGSIEPSTFADDAEGRWNDEGVPTIYLASDVAVAVSEFARHMGRGPDDPMPDGEDRDVWRIDIDLPAVVDLRSTDVADALGAPGAPHCFLDKELARRIARVLRDGGDIGALRTQPMAFLEDAERWNLVVFPEKLDGTAWFRNARRVGSLRLRPSG